MNAEELAKLFCLNGHDESQCQKLKLLREFEYQIKRETHKKLFERWRLCIECGMQRWLPEDMVKTEWGLVCTACYNSGDTGEPYFAVFKGPEK